MARHLLFGGSFDPIHHGHLIISRAAAEQVGAAGVVLIPSHRPPHKSGHELAAAEDRLEMCRRAVAGDPSFEVSDWELRQAGPSYTLHTVRHFQAEFGAGAELYWLVGADSLLELGTWHRVAELVDECRIVTAGRPGFDTAVLDRLVGPLAAGQVQRLRRDVLATPLVDMSATDIRLRLERGTSIRYLVPESVRGWIEARGLYQRAAKS